MRLLYPSLTIPTLMLESHFQEIWLSWHPHLPKIFRDAPKKCYAFPWISLACHLFLNDVVLLSLWVHTYFSGFHWGVSPDVSGPHGASDGWKPLVGKGALICFVHLLRGNIQNRATQTPKDRRFQQGTLHSTNHPFHTRTCACDKSN